MNSHLKFDYIIAKLNWASVYVRVRSFSLIYTQNTNYALRWMSLTPEKKIFHYKSVYKSHFQTQYIVYYIDSRHRDFCWCSSVQNKIKIIVIRCDVFNFLLSIENRNLQRQVKSIQSCTPSTSTQDAHTHRGLAAIPIMAFGSTTNSVYVSVFKANHKFTNSWLHTAMESS